MTFANDLFDAHSKHNRLSWELGDKLDRLFGEDAREGHADSYDHYDQSFEIYGCAPELRATAEQLAMAWEWGFDRFWINHRDGSETYYYKLGKPEGHHKARGLHAPPLVAG